MILFSKSPFDVFSSSILGLRLHNLAFAVFDPPTLNGKRLPLAMPIAISLSSFVYLFIRPTGIARYLVHRCAAAAVAIAC
ncbi:hypothetical protein CC78DRAFT_289554 [Lojkania enalia]|uniref:Uncharacterized protein n=1 Tax=Lojkania enalia TaxID=147567 RepID=A0A9P4K7A1_9PLEO|nr:hypothetical protein CC78DRAFT_289554 [Didymosphaeria enalia]